MLKNPLKYPILTKCSKLGLDPPKNLKKGSDPTLQIPRSPPKTSFSKEQDSHYILET